MCKEEEEEEKQLLEILVENKINCNDMYVWKKVHQNELFASLAVSIHINKLPSFFFFSYSVNGNYKKMKPLMMIKSDATLFYNRFDHTLTHNVISSAKLCLILDTNTFLLNNIHSILHELTVVRSPVSLAIDSRATERYRSRKLYTICK